MVKNYSMQEIRRFLNENDIEIRDLHNIHKDNFKSMNQKPNAFTTFGNYLIGQGTKIQIKSNIRKAFVELCRKHNLELPK